VTSPDDTAPTQGTASTFFREAALEHYLSADREGTALRVTSPAAWVILAGCMVIVLGTLLVAAVTTVEISGSARGVLRPAGGVQTLLCEVGGVVTHVYAASGDHVREGNLLLTLQSAGLQSELIQADRDIQLLESQAKPFQSRQSKAFLEQETTLRSRVATLEAEVESRSQSTATFERKLARTAELERSGLLSASSTDDAREALAEARRQVSGSRRALFQARQELSSLLATKDDTLWKAEQALQSARARRDALAILLSRLTIRAPAGGVLEGLVAKPGDLIQTGEPVGKLVPSQNHYRIVSLLPEKDRAYAKVGDTVKVELDQYPHREFSEIAARITRIEDDLASARGVRDAAGEDLKPDGAAYLMYLDLTEPLPQDVPREALRSGMLLTARYVLRREHPIAFLFSGPLRRRLRP